MQASTVAILFSVICFIAGAGSQCTNNGTYYPITKRCFSIGTQEKTFQSAMLDCFNNGGNLASIQGAIENMYLRDEVLDQNTNTSTYWIGGNSFNSVYSYWTWTDNSTFSYTAWALYQPQNSNTNQCLSVNSTRAQWYADDCFASYPYICELPLESA